MVCSVCGRDPDVFVLMPIKGERGELQTIGCVKCATERRVYCVRHQSPHLGFTDETHACVVCIEEDVRANLRCADEVFDRIAKEFPSAERSEIDEWLDDMCFLRHEQYTSVSQRRQKTLLRPIATLARRTGKSFDEMLTAVLRTELAAPFTEGAVPV